jgi:hypothetical protein
MLKEPAENPHHYKISAFFNFLQDKKKTAPGGGTPEAVRRNKPLLKLMFQPPLNIISHWGWLCYTHFPRKDR